MLAGRMVEHGVVETEARRCLGCRYEARSGAVRPPSRCCLLPSRNMSVAYHTINPPCCKRLSCLITCATCVCPTSFQDDESACLPCQPDNDRVRWCWLGRTFSNRPSMPRRKPCELYCPEGPGVSKPADICLDGAVSAACRRPCVSTGHVCRLRRGPPADWTSEDGRWLWSWTMCARANRSRSNVPGWFLQMRRRAATPLRRAIFPSSYVPPAGVAKISGWSEKQTT
ncbi:uncharacterized protein B0H18DRAFT_188063 [Fomitopsis serialis]|uniref:uncharacterized protein n=1 Tax=Fomitopsis serialis TaxID=139415 RepID=UPI002008172D|nr:uncharacterized protein B0H18DRAFT_188063 [Neoantrodia serialis]KAH9937124.1 hypothetical protein B0H18DRAFT_188063 [Neoantrodia serialis]